MPSGPTGRAGCSWLDRRYTARDPFPTTGFSREDRHAAEEAPLHPLGGELYRSERILDLVREPAGDLAPRGITLRLQHDGDVIEHDHVASGLALFAR